VETTLTVDLSQDSLAALADLMSSHTATLSVESTVPVSVVGVTAPGVVSLILIVGMLAGVLWVLMMRRG